MTTTRIIQTIKDTDEGTKEERALVMEEVTNRGLKSYLSIDQILWFFVGLVELLLATRLLLKYIGANLESPFARFIYNVTHPLVAPFIGLVPNPELTGNVIDLATLSAIIVYLIGAAILSRIIWFLLGRSPNTET